MSVSNSSSAVYAVIFGVSFCCWLAMEVWVFYRDRGKTTTNARGGGLGVLLALIVGITLALNAPRMAPGLNIQSHVTAYFVSGIILIWLGIFLRFWAIRTLGKFFSTRLIVQDQHELITTGPYKFLRNPSYTGALVLFIGFGLAIGNWLSLAILVLTAVIVYVRRIGVEERMLAEQFGQAFADYKKRNWALIPFVW